MAMGCGRYVLGAVSTVIVMVSEVFLGRRGYFSRKAGEERELEIEYKDSDKEDIFSYINKTIEDAGCKMENIKLADEDSLCVLSAVLKAPDELDAALLVGELKKRGIHGDSDSGSGVSGRHQSGFHHHADRDVHGLRRCNRN